MTARDEQVRIERLKAELRAAFATPDDNYVQLTADVVIARNLGRRAK